MLSCTLADATPRVLLASAPTVPARWGELARLREELALERLVLAPAPRMLSDGPGPDEALADELRLRGYFREPDTSARRPRRPRSPRA